ncbi:aminotransferase class I and II [Luteimonas aestuarii]|uniref:Aminotransferase class I and II n=1 Tax=Luteimonas aestuarii TaxID=453837 RepID=A0A4R5TPR5_9GAMM|nr:HipA family kinase [Luteimonas aestuarii]TDK23174.1 aminotransferase class I and II [Luteimonas aestuarii]
MRPRHVRVTRYVTPLREGGSMPAVVEADDQGLYVLKFRGAGQGPRVLVAEWIVGQLARTLGFDVPEIVFADLDPLLARTEGDPEIQDLIRASGGLNLAMDYLPGAANFDPLAWTPDPALAARIAWFDAFTSNVDRTARNPNLMLWHDRLYLIDHGAALYFHHGWDGDTGRAEAAFPLIRDHVLLPCAGDIAAADAALAAQLDDDTLRAIVAQVPDDWLEAPDAFADAATQRAAYAEYLIRRLRHRDAFVEEIMRARA